MKNNFTEGFKFEGMTYGWKGSRLFRLSFISDTGRHYTTRELTKVSVGLKKGFVVGQYRKTIEQLKELTVKLNQEDLILKGKGE